jgi:hypothetical protein
VPYAVAISSVLTSFVPRTAERYGCNARRGLLTLRQQRSPIRSATSTTVAGRSRSISCAYTVFTDLIVAERSVIVPYPAPSAFVTSQISPDSRAIWSVEGAGNVSDGDMPASRAATKANGLKDEPDCRPVPPIAVARLTRPASRSRQ